MGNKGSSAAQKAGEAAAQAAVGANKFKNNSLVASELRIQDNKQMERTLDQGEARAAAMAERERIRNQPDEEPSPGSGQKLSLGSGSSSFHAASASHKQPTPRIRKESTALRAEKPELTLTLKKKKLPNIKHGKRGGARASPSPVPPQIPSGGAANNPPQISTAAPPSLPKPTAGSATPKNGIGADGIKYSTFVPRQRKFSADDLPSNFSPETNDSDQEEERRRTQERIRMQQQANGFNNSSFRSGSSSPFQSGGYAGGGFGGNGGGYAARSQSTTILNTSTSPKKPKQKLNFGAAFAMPAKPVVEESVFDDDDEALMDQILA